MMQDWADRLDLFEQNMVEAASMPLTIHVEGVSAVTNEQANGAEPPKTTAASPILLVTKPGDAVPLVTASAHRLSAVTLPQPAAQPLSDVQRERMELIDVFESPHNLPVAAYAKLAGKSRRWISYEVRAGNLLALNVGNRGQRVPDWHLDPHKHALIQAVLKLNRDADPWKIYHALLKPRGALGRRSAIEAVTADNLDKAIMVVSTDVKEGEWFPLQVA
jgi:hypothetical protein